MKRANRLNKIVHFIRERRYAVTAERISEEFQISKRTVYRDIQTLLQSGVPIVGEAGVGYMIDAAFYLPPITFDAEELEALGLGISIVHQWTDPSFAAKAETALEKIKAALPKELQGELEQITVFSLGRKSQVPWSVELTTIRESIRARRKLAISYTDSRGEETARVVRPLALVFAGPLWLLGCWCELRNDFRSFRVDRIASFLALDELFQDDPEINLAAYKSRTAKQVND